MTTGAAEQGRPRGGGRIGLWLALALLALALGVAAAGLALTGRKLALPVWAVVLVEDRVNHSLQDRMPQPGMSLALGAVDLGLSPDFAPEIAVRDLRLLDAGGVTVLALPDVAARLDLRLALVALRLSGARLTIERDAQGGIGLSLPDTAGAAPLPGRAGRPGDLLDLLDRAFDAPALRGLDLIEADALVLTLRDARAGRVWEVGDGRLAVENRPDGVALDLGFTLLDGATPGQARLTVETAKADASARFTARLTQVAARDLAAQAAPLALMAALDAPISGELSGQLGADGALGGLTGQLTVGKGAVAPQAGAAPVLFDGARLALEYDPARQRLLLSQVSVESPSLRFRASGHVDLTDAEGRPAPPGVLPVALIGQFRFAEVGIDPEGLFEAPVRFGSGAVDLRLWLSPFRLDIGQLTLAEAGETLALSGQLSAARTGGWQGALDVALDRISTDRLVRIWPLAVVPNTRAWLAQNVGQGQLTDVEAALRLTPGAAPRFALSYDFSGAEVRFIRSLPPVQDGQGRAGIEGTAYTVVLDRGTVTAPAGGEIAVGGSVFQVPDIGVFPAQAEVLLLTDADLGATLSLLDAPPFGFVTKAGRRVDLGTGRAVLAATLRFPLVNDVTPAMVDYQVSGRIVDFASDQLVPGQVVRAADLAVTVSAQGIAIAGDGTVGDMAVTARYEQRFAPGAVASLRGTATVSDATLRGLGVRLPSGWLGGKTEARVEMDLPRGQAARLSLSSDLRGAVLAVPVLGWSKAAATGGRLALDAVLGAAPEVTRLALEAPGLTVSGRLQTGAGGALELAVFDRVRAGDWLDAGVELRGAQVRLTGGSLDLRGLPGGGSGAAGGASGAVEVALDSLRVSDSIALTGFSGAFRLRGSGIDGTFRASVNGQGRVEGAAVPVSGGTAVRLTSADAGTVMAAAGIFAKGRGGSLDLTLQPRPGRTGYAGNASFRDLSVQDAPALAGLLGAISVVGLLDQLQGDGIVFSEGDVAFVIGPGGVQIMRGAAVGLSMGLSFEGLYRAKEGSIDIRGTISPLYLLNGIGQIFARPGEGLFGFTYRLAGPVGNPTISVNPLSILTPGMFRDLFRRAPPKLEGGG